MTHEPGPELDGLVAEKVMGGASHCPFRCPECGGDHFGTTFSADLATVQSRNCHDEYGRGCNWSGPPIACVPRYSRDISAAFEVVEKMREMKRASFRLDTGDGILVDDKVHKAAARFFYAGSPAWVFNAGAGTAPLAICLAALRAVGALQ